MNYMGIDIGTSGCKAVVFDENGQQLAAAYREYQVIFSGDDVAEFRGGSVKVQHRLSRQVSSGRGPGTRGVR